MFNFSLVYNDPSVEASKRLYNGNIAQTSWQTENVDKTKRSYIYDYDALNRLTAAIGTTTSNYNLKSVAYDKNGNITNLWRKGQNGTAGGVTPTFGDMDILYYYYNGNRLRKVLDNGKDTYGFKDGANATTEYIYDQNGNMISDANKQITSIQYNHFNLPTTISFASSSVKEINYVYDATGIKLRKEVIDEVADIETTIDYAGKFVYENNHLKQFVHSEGYTEKDNNDFNYVYNYKDHLGSVRLTYSDLNKDGIINASTEILQERNTYPFGLEHKGYNSTIRGRENNYQTYLGQEINKELGLDWLTFRYRNYIPEIGRFFGVDPISEDYLSITNYQFAHNNPIWKIELEGLEGYPTSGFDGINNEPIVGHTMLSTQPEIGSTASSTGGRRMVVIESSLAPSTEYRSGAFNDGDFNGVIRPATDAMYNRDAGLAVFTDLMYAAATFTGLNAIDDAVSTANNPNSSNLDVAEAAFNAVTTGKSKSKGPNPQGKPRRPYLRKKTVTKTWEANKNSEGKVIDPTGKEITWDKTKKRNGQWDMGHKPGKEFKKDWALYKKGELTWDQMKERYNDFTRYRPELPSTNRSHKFEEK
ncbi:hypothetical protein TAMYLO_410001 [Tenacibaculum amylolyticum]